MNTLTCSQQLSSENPFPSHAFSNRPPKQNTAAFYTYIYRTFMICSGPSNHSNELNGLKSLVPSRGYNPSAIDKALNKFKKSKRSVCHSDPCLNPMVLPFYSLISFKIFKIPLRFGYKVYFKSVFKTGLYSPKDSMHTENRNGIYFIPCLSCNLGYNTK